MTSNRARRPFTAEENKLLEKRRNEGIAINDIAVEMGRSRNSVESRLCKIGLTDDQEPRRRWNAEEDAFLEHNSTTMSIEDIARALGRSACAIKKRIFRLREKRTESKKPPLPRAAEKQDTRKHGWNLRTQQEKSAVSRRMAAITAVEQAMNQIVKSKDQHNVHIS